VRSVCAVALALCVACGAETSAPEAEDAPSLGTVERDSPTVVVVVVDGLRPDHLPTGGYRLPTAPHLAQLAEEGVVFEDVIASSSGANAGLASLLTGLHPDEHGVGSLRHRGQHRLAEARRTLPELLAAEGWRTFGAVSLPQLAADVSGLAQGFEVWYAPGLHAGTLREAPATWYNARTELAGLFEEERPVFALLHFADPGARSPAPGAEGTRFLEQHLGPFRESMPLVAEALGRAATAPDDVLADLHQLLGRRRGSDVHTAWTKAGYDSRVTVVDHFLGELLDLLRRTGRYERSTIVVTATRGAVLSPPPATGAPGFVPGLIEVPLVLRFPGGRPHGHFSDLVSAVDLAPTLAEVVGVPLEPGAGESWVERIEGSASSPAAVLCISADFDRRVMVGERYLVEEQGIAGYAVWERSAAPVLERMLEEDQLLEVEDLKLALDAARRPCEVVVEKGQGVELTARWRFARGLASPARIEGERVARPLRVSGLTGTARMGSEPCGLVVEEGGRELPLRLDLDFGEGSFDPERVLVGDLPLSRSLLPRLPSKGAPAWPLDEAGTPLPARAQLEDRGSGWWCLTLDGEEDRGREVRGLVVLYPPGTLERELRWDSGLEVEVTPVAGRQDALRFSGRAPLTLSFERPSPAVDFALALAVEGRVLDGGEIRHRERAFGEPEEVALYLPDWIEGVTDDLLGYAEGPPAPGQVRIRRRGPHLAPADRAPAELELREFARRLGGRE